MHVNNNVPAVRLMVRAMPASAAVWVAVLLFAGLPAAALALPPGMLGVVGQGEGSGQARLALEGGGIGGRIALAARRLAPTKPGCAIVAWGSCGGGFVEVACVPPSEPARGALAAGRVRVEHMDLPPPQAGEAR